MFPVISQLHLWNVLILNWYTCRDVNARSRREGKYRVKHKVNGSLTTKLLLHVHCISWSAWYLPHGTSLWPWREHTGSHSSGESSRYSSHHSVSLGGSSARKWHLFSWAPHARTQKSCVECNCTIELLPSTDWDRPLLQDTEKTSS